ncbi:MAG: tetratricopeptide repeat protein [Planctomycetia bacterium]|nr:tetratricopeptide repeat protein [Planctomycetia bacterium]
MSADSSAETPQPQAAPDPDVAALLARLASPQARDEAIANVADVLGRLAAECSDRGRVLQQIAGSISQNAANAAYFFNLASALRERGHFELAQANYARALEIDPHDAQARLALGEVLTRQGKAAEAAETYRQALDQDASCAAAHRQLGMLLLKRDELDLARVHLREAARHLEDDIELFTALGELFERTGDIDAATEAYTRAARLRPFEPDARLLCGELELQAGRWETGWREYQWRRVAENRSAWRYTLPFWDGRENVTSLLVRSERSAAADVLFAACLPDLLAQAPRCTVECHPRLVELFRQSFPEAEVVSAAGPPMEKPAAEAQVFLGSLPRRYRPTPRSASRRAAYLRAPADGIRRWRKALRQRGAGLRVGIAWRPRGDVPRQNLPPLAAWRAILAQPGLRFVCLQPDPRPDELALLEGLAPRRVDAPEGNVLSDLSERAGLIEAVDLVIAVPGVTAHLAGSLGARTVTILPLWPSWPWMARGQSVPWYEAMRLFRQARPGQWDDVFDAAAAELAAMTKNAPPPPAGLSRMVKGLDRATTRISAGGSEASP